MTSQQQTPVNTDPVSNQGEFHASRPRDNPMTTKGHQIGTKASPTDGVSTFAAQTLPPGTAPEDRTFEPQNLEARARTGDEVHPSPLEGIPGVTSRDVHTGLGHPGQGETSVEERHDGQHGRKKQREGLSRYGEATGI